MLVNEGFEKEKLEVLGIWELVCSIVFILGLIVVVFGSILIGVVMLMEVVGVGVVGVMIIVVVV